MKNNSIQSYTKTVDASTTGEILFDITLFGYICAFVVFNNDKLIDVTGYDSIIRSLSTLLVFFVGSYLTFNNNRGLWSKLIHFKFYFCFTFLGLFSALWAEDTQQVFSLAPTLIRVLFISVFLCARIRNEYGFKAVFVAFIASVFVKVFFVANMMYTFYGDELLSQRFGDNFGYNPNDTAVMCVCAISMLTYFYFSSKNNLYKIFDVICILFLVVVVFVTQSRKGLIGIALFPLLFLCFDRVSLKKRALLVVIVTMFFILLIYSSFYNDISGGALDRLNGLFADGSMKDGSTIMRENLISKAMSIWYENPLCGIGLNNFALHSGVSKGYYSHNNYTELLSGLGLIGFLLYYMPIICVLMKMFTRRIKTPLAILLQCLVVVLLFLDVGNISYCSFYIQVIYTLLFLCYFYNKKHYSILNNIAKI